MTEPYHEMDTAPLDGSWVMGMDKAGRVARIQSRVTHPKFPSIRHWAEGEAVTHENGNWTTSVCFYPVVWWPEP